MQATQGNQHNTKTLLTWALAMGIGLLLMHNWATSMADVDAKKWLIWPLYALIITLPFSMMLLAERPQKQAFKLALSFSVIAAICAALMGYASYSPQLETYYNRENYWVIGLSIWVAWFIYITFAEHFSQHKQWFSHYESLFDFSWRNAVKLITAGIFTGLFWLALILLGVLFKTINISFFSDLFENRHFYYPATALAFGFGLSLYVTNQKALSEFKRAILQVMGYLLPLVSLILLSFIIVLPFNGLSAFWSRGYDTCLSIMLGLMSLMVFLVNAAFQDGREAKYPAWLLKLTNIGLLSMPIYTLICAYGLSLRVTELGWTAKRVWAASWILMMMVYAFGYARAAIKSFTVKSFAVKSNAVNASANWLQGIKGINVFAAFSILAMLVLLNSPILNPQRIGVQSQMAQLLAGKIKANTFNYQYLRFEAGHYGHEALLALQSNKNVDIQAQAKAVLAAKDYSYVQTPQQAKFDTPEAFAAKFTVYPKGQNLEPEFYNLLITEQKKGELYFDCLNDLTKKAENCRALKIDLNNDKIDEVVVLNPYGNRLFAKTGAIWSYVGDFRVDDYGDNLAKDFEVGVLESGNFKVITPDWSELQFGQQKWRVEKKCGKPC
jgi:hypothetical protein